MHESEPSSESIYFVGKCSWVVLEQYWVQDTLAALIVKRQSWRMNSKIERNKWAFHLFCSEYSLLLCVCLCVVFCQIRVYCVEWQFFGDSMNSDPESSLPSARNASVKITKLFVKLEVNSFKHESESSSKSIFFVEECSWVLLEQYWVQDTSAALLVQSQSCRMNNKIERNKLAFHLF